MQLHWRSDGFTVPNADTYPYQWLWDSCFHALIWKQLGRSDRAVAELESIFSVQHSDGFVPHMNYHSHSQEAMGFWGRAGASYVTQPPMFGHALAELMGDSSVVIPPSLIDSALAGLEFLYNERRRDAYGLVELVHPWESGCDDSPRWDGALLEASKAADSHGQIPTPGSATALRSAAGSVPSHSEPVPGVVSIAGLGFGPALQELRWTREKWHELKLDLLNSIEFNEYGSAISNDRFAVSSVGFNALLAFNTFELVKACKNRFTDFGFSPTLSTRTKSTGMKPTRTKPTGAKDSDFMGFTNSDLGARLSRLEAQAEELRTVLQKRWSPADFGVWCDGGALEHSSGNAPTLDSMLCLLVESREEVLQKMWKQLLSQNEFLAPFGLRGTSKRFGGYQPDTYWRGPVWPQLCYLMVLAAKRISARQISLGEVLHKSGFAGESCRPHELAEKLAELFVLGAQRSRLSEYWNPENGQSAGACPQSWAGLAVMFI